jgi:hypothetical protein
MVLTVDEHLTGAKEEVAIGGKRLGVPLGAVQGHGIPIEETGQE